MKKYKLYGLIAAALVLLAAGYFFFFRSAPSAEYNQNLLANGDFALADENGNPVGWYREAYDGLSGSDFEAVTEDGGAAAHIVNRYPKDSRFVQEVSVEPDTLYCLRGFIKADTEGGRGANLSIEGGYFFSEQVYDSQGQWQEVAVYGRTGKDQHVVHVFARLGGYSGESQGEAYFRGLNFTKVEGVADGYIAQNWGDTFTAAAEDGKGGRTDASFLLAAVSLVYLFLFVFLCRFLRVKKQALQPEKGLAASPLLAAALLLCALALRLLLSFSVPGYNVDIGCFRAWAEKMASAGPAGFYPPEDPFSFCDYPPGYMWVLWALGGLGRLFGTGVTEWMVKMPPILADMALCAVLYVYAKKELSSPAALVISLLYAFNPLVMTAGAAWGQADALMTLLLALALLFALKGKWRFALPLYIAAVLFKPQALMFGPLGLTAFGADILGGWKDAQQRKTKLREALLGLVFMAVTALVLALPFSIYLSPDWLITLYQKTMGRYAYATVNACNIYFLLGKNWVSSSSGLQEDFLPAVLAYLLAVGPLVCAELVRLKKGQNPLAEKNSRIRLFGLGGTAAALGLSLLIMGLTGSLTYASLGTVMIVYCVAVFALLYALGSDPSNLPLLAAGMLLLLFSTGSMMHERYLFPVAALLLLAYILKKDVRVLWLAVGVTIAGFLNVGCVLDRNIRIGGSAGHLDAPCVALNSDMAVLEYFSAFLNSCLCFASLWLSASAASGKTVEISETAFDRSPLPKEAPLRKMTVRDWIILSAITVAYAVLAFTNLGSSKAPQTAFVSASPEEEIVLDLGDSYTFQMLFYGGIHQYDSDFTVEIGEDGQRYDQAYIAGLPVGDCFKWKYLSSSASGTYPVTLTGRYVRITADHYGLTLFEVLFRDAETGASLQAQVVSDLMYAQVEVKDPETGEVWIDPRTNQPMTHRQMTEANNETVYALVDEPDSMEGDYPSWYNSTYFDEIYHARTAYEHLHQMQPYEYTHPPLGKVIMSFCIAIFGMTPFGWRFAGALAGVLMLPGMYLLGKLLIKRSWGGLGAALLMAFDLMHFTQTRIATIDSFVVLFIIWMVYFMLRWFFLDYFATPFWKTLVPLFLSGLCMGLGIASKWTGCYAGLVLALIFFFGVWRRWRLIRAAREKPEKDRDEKEAAAAVQGTRNLLITLGCCVVFFVLIPCAVYYCAYIPFFSYDGAGVSVSKIIDETERMFSYHSQPGLGMDHDFYSPWYQWPIIGKPMWYSANSFEPAGYQMTISAMGNPALWWTGLLCVLILGGICVFRHLRKDLTLSPSVRRDDPRYALMLICYFVQLLPWVLVPRGTYIYHYFPCVPFLALSILLCLDTLADGSVSGPEGALAESAASPRKTEKIALILLIALLVLSLALFIAFFPFTSGVLTRQSWLDAMRWFSRWLWY